MKTFKFDEKKYTDAINTVAEQLLAMAQEDAVDKTAWRPPLEEVVEDYSSAAFEQIGEKIAELMK